MTENIKNRLCELNGLTELRKDELINKKVAECFSPNEENAFDRKMIASIISAVQLLAKNSNIENIFDYNTLNEFNTYNSKVNNIKATVKSSLNL